MSTEHEGKSAYEIERQNLAHAVSEAIQHVLRPRGIIHLVAEYSMSRLTSSQFISKHFIGTSTIAIDEKHGHIYRGDGSKLLQCSYRRPVISDQTISSWKVMLRVPGLAHIQDICVLGNGTVILFFMSTTFTGHLRQYDRDGKFILERTIDMQNKAWVCMTRGRRDSDVVIGRNGVPGYSFSLTVCDLKEADASQHTFTGFYMKSMTSDEHRLMTLAGNADTYMLQLWQHSHDGQVIKRVELGDELSCMMHLHVFGRWIAWIDQYHTEFIVTDANDVMDVSRKHKQSIRGRNVVFYSVDGDWGAVDWMWRIES